MTKNKPPLGVRRRSQPCGPWLSEEMVFGLSRGLASAPRQHRSGRPITKPETVPTFEETYPNYPFSELVRLGTLLGRWLAKRLGREQQEAARSSRHRT